MSADWDGCVAHGDLCDVGCLALTGTQGAHEHHGVALVAVADRAFVGGPVIAFTICSNNYLAQARTLGDSVVLHNPGVTFVIGLVDRLCPDVDYDALGPFVIIPVEELSIAGFDDLWKRYGIMELNTAVKPFYFSYLFQRYVPDVVIYFDPDIELFAPLATVRDELGDAMALLTPHALTPLPDDGTS
jgi:hypothetical protein